MMKLLHCVVGPTAAGKTAYAIRLAQRLHTEIVSCDSRQCYRELRIGVARPSDEELATIPHHFIACRSILQPYNVYEYEQEVLQCLDRLFTCYDEVVAVGGSGLYVDALCYGISLLPTPSPELRAALQQRLATDGVQPLLDQLRHLDPAYADRVDPANPVRIQRALEVCLTAQRPYSLLMEERRPKPRPFSVRFHHVDMPTDQLRQRICSRVDQMLSDGLEAEARQLQHLWQQQHPQALNTVGYKEFYEPLPDNSNPTAPHSIREWIQRNTWHYARKQRTWFKKYPKE